jgi:hypothetical protein
MDIVGHARGFVPYLDRIDTEKLATSSKKTEMSLSTYKSNRLLRIMGIIGPDFMAPSSYLPPKDVGRLARSSKQTQRVREKARCLEAFKHPVDYEDLPANILPALRIVNKNVRKCVHDKTVRYLLNEKVLTKEEIIKALNEGLMREIQTHSLHNIRILLDAGADVNHADNRGMTALIAAQQEGHDEIATLLLEHGATINQEDANGTTVLMFACRWGQTDIVKFLLERGANVNQTNNLGWTALMRAANRGNTMIAELLLDSGADPNLKDNRGR